MRLEELEIWGRRVPLIHLGSHEEAVVFSDTHFGLNYGGEELSLHEELSNFLEWLSSDGGPSLLVLLGDIFEFWSASLRDVFLDAFNPLRLIARLNSSVVFVSGNHDRIPSRIHFPGSRWAGEFHTTPDILLLDIDGRKVLLFHGHQLDSLFIAVKGLWRVQSYVYLFSEMLFALPGPLEWFFAGLATLTVLLLLFLFQATSLLMEATIILASIILFSPLIILLWRDLQDKVWYGIVQKIGPKLFKSRLRGKSIESLAVSKPLRKLVSFLESYPEIGRVDLVIFGHTHVPGYLVSNGKVFINTGSWVRNSYDSDNGVENKTYARIGGGKVRLCRWDDKEVVLFESEI
jgi:UDP-2,3-diacylglucosamine pyrophosphatase LpxH